MIIDFLNRTIGKRSFLLPSEVTVNGTIEATISGRIDGLVKGDVKTEGKLVIGESAVVRGHVHATELMSQGKIYGDVFVSHKAIIANTAYVRGDVTALVLTIQEGAVIEGAIRKEMITITAEDLSTAAPITDEALEDKHTPPEEEQVTSWF
jgi:cytoskeletal protein CcmA (bactofilin family)